MSEAEAPEGAEGTEKKAVAKKKIPILLIALGGQALLVLICAGIITKGALYPPKVQMTKKAVKDRAIASIKDDLAKVENLDLETFAVNLKGQRILRAAIQVEISDAATGALIRQRMPAVRARVLQVLSSQTPEDSWTFNGKLRLKDAIREAINDELLSTVSSFTGIVRDVYFMEFVLI